MANKIELLITLPHSEEILSALKSEFEQVNIAHIPSLRGEEITEEQWGKTEVLFTGRAFPADKLAPNLRWIQLMSAGVDRYIDNPLFDNTQLQFTSMSGANASQVAEHVIAMLLALGHRLPMVMRHQSRNDWPSDRGNRFQPKELRDSTVGIVGYGSIGRQIARLLQEFGTTILASKVDLKDLGDGGYSPKDFGDETGELPARIYPAEALRSMFKDCDFIVVATPLTEKTRGMIGKEQIRAMKSEAFIVDISRGGIVDHKALTEALQTKTIGGAALDVFPEEPLASDNPLWDLDNVILTPHIAGSSAHSEARSMELFRNNLERYLAGQPLLNIVVREKGY